MSLSTVVIAIVLAHSGTARGWRRWRRSRRPRRAALLTGVLVTRLKVVPFIVTLGMMLLVRGAAKGLADERRWKRPRPG